MWDRTLAISGHGTFIKDFRQAIPLADGISTGSLPIRDPYISDSDRTIRPEGHSGSLSPYFIKVRKTDAQWQR